MLDLLTVRILFLIILSWGKRKWDKLFWRKKHYFQEAIPSKAQPRDSFCCQKLSCTEKITRSAPHCLCILCSPEIHMVFLGQTKAKPTKQTLAFLCSAGLVNSCQQDSSSQTYPAACNFFHFLQPAFLVSGFLLLLQLSLCLHFQWLSFVTPAFMKM